MKRVYFIRAAGRTDSLVKIGCSQSPEARCSRLLEATPFPLEISATIEGSFRLESRFHAHFQAQHFQGEWFHPSEELERVIAAVKAGSFDIETLPPPIDLRRLGGKYPTGPLSPEVMARRHEQRLARYARRIAAFRSQDAAA